MYPPGCPRLPQLVPPTLSHYYLQGVRSWVRLTDHVKIQEGCSGCKVILVEDTLKLHVEQYSTLSKSLYSISCKSTKTASVAWTHQTTPWIKGTTLKLIQRIESRRALLPVASMEVSWQVSWRPGVRVSTIETKRVWIMTINIYISLGCAINDLSWCEKSLSP